jgi:SM-20-related protein
MPAASHPGSDGAASASAAAFAAVVASVAHDLAERGWAQVDGFLDPVDLHFWRRWALTQRERLAPARVGRDRLLVPTVRGDRTLWVDDLRSLEGGPSLAARFDALRIGLNRRCLLGLEDLELHLACYPPGERYAPHHDRVRGDDTRTVSCVLYLNEAWQPEAGGELCLFESDDPSGSAHCVLPVGGRLMLFLAEGCLHEVRPARRERWSLTGWFRRRAAD